MRVRRWAGVVLALAGVPAAEAHLVTTGLGPVYDGIGHFLLTPEDVLAVVALALLAGLRGAESGRRALFLLPVAWLAGGLAGLQATGLAEPAFAAVSFLVLGALVAADLRLPAMAVAGLAIGLGAVHGFFNGVVLGGDGPGGRGLLGIAATVFVCVALGTALVVAARADWLRVIVRVAGSWIAAAGLLMVGWAVRAGG